MEEHVNLNAAGLQDYSPLRAESKAIYHAGRNWGVGAAGSSSHLVPMEVDAFAKGKSKGKGKDKNKSKEKDKEKATAKGKAEGKGGGERQGGGETRATGGRGKSLPCLDGD